MAHSMSTKGARPVTADDFVGFYAARRRAEAGTLGGSQQQSQVDQLITDLMDIIVRAAAAASGKTAGPAPVDDATAELVALSMMQALLEREVCSSF